MQRSLLSPRDRAGSVIAVLLVHAAIVAVLLTAQRPGSVPRDDAVPIQTFDVALTEPAPPPVVKQVPDERMEREEGAASPPNLVSTATPLQAPEPLVRLPFEPPVTVTPTPNSGFEMTQGAAPVPGPGTGAGGIGTGTGSGGFGSGTGGGGSGQAPQRPSVIESTTLTSRDYPREVTRTWPSGGRAFVAVRVQVDGRASDCKINRSSGSPLVDYWTCRLVEQQVRFRPAINEQGQPYVAWYGYIQAPVNF